MKKMLFLVVCSALFVVACDTYEEDHDHHRHHAAYYGETYDRPYYGYERGTAYRAYPDTTITTERAYVRPSYGDYRVRDYRY